MIDLFDLYTKFKSDNNTFQGGLFRPETDFEATVNSISLDIWNDLVSQAEKSQEISDELAVFMKSVNIQVEKTRNNYGLVRYPKDPSLKTYGRFSAARILIHNDTTVTDDDLPICGVDGQCVADGHKETETEKEQREAAYKDGIVERNISLIPSSKWGSKLTHRDKAPTFEDPAMTQYDEGFKVAPRTVSVVVLDYFFKPSAATFKYDIAPGNAQSGAGDYIIYNKNASKPLEWRESMIPEFLRRLSIVYSKYTRDGLLFQMNNAK